MRDDSGVTLVPHPARRGVETRPVLRPVERIVMALLMGLYVSEFNASGMVLQQMYDDEYKA